MFVNPVHYAPYPAALAMLGWLGKYVFNSFQTEWRDVKTKLNSIAMTTQNQAENHLQTIQHNTAQTNDLLVKVIEGQAETNGFLKGAFRG